MNIDALGPLKHQLSKTLYFFVEGDLKQHGHITQGTLNAFEHQKTPLPVALNQYVRQKTPGLTNHK